MLLSYLLQLTMAMAGEPTSTVGEWRVACGDTLLDLIDNLRLPEYQPILDLNPGLMPGYVQAGESYRVPYVAAVPPARWDIMDGHKVLHLHLNRTQSCYKDRQVPSLTREGDRTAPITEKGSLSSLMMSTSSDRKQSFSGTIPGCAGALRSVSSTADTVPASLSPPSNSQADPIVSLISLPTGVRNDCGTATSGAPTHDSSDMFQGLKCRQKSDATTVYGAQGEYAARFCKEYSRSELNNDTDSIHKMYYYDNNHFFRFVVSWLPNCRLRSSQVVDTSEANCTNVMIDNFRRCKAAIGRILNAN